MTIRDFCRHDFERGLLVCLNALAATNFPAEEHPPLPPALKTDSWVDHFSHQRENLQVRTFVAVDNDHDVIGTASVYLYPTYLHGGTWAGHIEDVAVHPVRRGQGVGRALIAYCLAHCREQGCYKVVLNCSQKNVPFYEKCGFRQTADGFMRCDLEEEFLRDFSEDCGRQQKHLREQVDNLHPQVPQDDSF